MIKCLAIVFLLGLTVSAFDFDGAHAGKRSNRLNMLSKTVGARMLAGTNGQMDQNGLQMTGTQNQFFPIPRTSNAPINSLQQQGVDNTIGGQFNDQQLTADQIQKLHQFINSPTQQQQQQTQQQAVPQFQQTQPTQQQFGQQTQQFGQQPTQQFGQQTTQQFGQQPTQQFGQQTQQTFSQQPTQQFGQQTAQRSMMPTQQQQPQQQQVFRMDSSVNGGMMDQSQFAQNGRITQQATPSSSSVFAVPPTSTTTTTTTTPVPQTFGSVAAKPSALEQQLLDQQIMTQKLKEQLFNLQQVQQRMNGQQTPTTTTVVTPTGFPSAAVQQQQQFQLQQQQAIQQQTIQQQQLQQQKFNQQQQQLLNDQISQLNQQKLPTQQQQIPTVSQSFVSSPVNVSRVATQMRPTPPQQFQQKGAFTQGRVFNDICANSKPGDLLPHPLDETQFVICNELGEITLMDCPNHTVFNPHLKLCDVTGELPLLCKSNPCLNGAKCVEVSPVQFRCECPQGFSGTTCEKFDTCSSSRPCGSDGVCLSFALGSPIPHVCLCNGGRSVGLTCDKSEPNPCLVTGSNTKLMQVGFNRAVFAHCEGARPHFKFCQPPLMFSAGKQACEWTV